ncbi:MAG: hypothetical protein QF570_12055 [Myxococcota bacterium]|jgi:DMSO reductase family type II enzyme heme b subunit|nr:hypothetical protein [Myxococcota bacterium]
MVHKVSLIAAPTGLSPGGYVKKAFADRNAPQTPVAELEVVKGLTGWRIRLEWDCSDPVTSLADDVDRFVDAAAILAPGAPDAPWMSMGAPGKPVEGALWRADREALFGVRAEGLGTVERSDAPAGWSAMADRQAGKWRVSFHAPSWSALDAQQQLAVAVWQGAKGDRGGLKSVSSGWIAVGS